MNKYTAYTHKSVLQNIFQLQKEKKTEILSFRAKWMQPETLMLGEISPT